MSLLAGCERSEQDSLALARSELAAKNPSAASIHLKNALAKSPNDGEVRLLLGQLLLSSGDHAAAAIELRRSRELKVADDRVVPLLATALLESGGHRVLLEQLSAVRLSTPEAAADLAASVALAHLAQGQADRARQVVTAALQEFPNSPHLLLAQVRVLIAEGNPAEALKVVGQLVGAFPANDKAWSLKGDVHGALGQLPESRAAYDHALTVNPTQLHALFASGLDQATARDSKKARETLDRLRKHWPEYSGTLYLDGRLKYIDGDHAGARTSFARVLNVVPNNVGVLVASGLNELRLLAPIQAEAFLARAVSLAPEHVTARFYLAQAQLQLSRPDKAAASIAPLLKSEQASPQVLVTAARAKLLQGDAVGADQLFARATAMKPADPDVRTVLAAARLGRPEERDAALRELEQIADSATSSEADLRVISARLARKETKEALSAVDGYIRKNPKSPAGPELRGQVQQMAGDAAAARRSFEESLKLDPAYGPALAQMTAIDVAEKRADEARARLKAVLAKDPRNSQVLTMLAGVEATVGGDAKTAVELLEQATREDALNVSAWMGLLTRHLTVGDYQAGLLAAAAANKAVPDNAGILELTGRIQIGAGNLNQANSTYASLTRVAPRAAAGYMGQAAALLAAKDTAAASQAIQRFLAIDPRSIDALRMASDLAVTRNQHAEALRYATELQRLLPEDGFGHLTQARIELARNRPDAAMSAIRAALAKKRPDAAPQMLHDLLLKQGKADAAKEFADGWSKRTPPDRAFAGYLADIQLASKDWKGAAESYRRLTELDPANGAAFNNLAWAYVQMGDARALEAAKVAVTLQPNRPEILDTLAQAHLIKKDAAAAIAALRQGINRAPDPAPLQLSLARIYVQAGDRPNAEAQLQAVLDRGKTHPQFAAARKLQVELRAK